MRTRNLILVIILLFLSDGITGEHFQGSNVITAQMIRESGLIRISDIFSLIGDWNVTTIDGFQWKASANGLSSFQKQNWIVMLDGQRMDLDVINIKHLNMLPVTVDQIDSVLIISTPQIYYGEFTEGGLIHIFTDRPGKGIAVKARDTIGNETGDPGPYYFTEYSSENVDRLGPDYSAVVTLATPYLQFRTGLAIQNHYSTDDVIRQRLRNLNSEYLRGQVVSPSFLIASDILGGHHEIQLFRSTTDRFAFVGPWGSALLYFKPFGKEVPVQTSLTHVGASGSIIGSKNLIIRYSMKHSRMRLSKPYPGFEIDFDWNLARSHANLEGSLTAGMLEGTVGATLDRSLMKTDYLLKNNVNLTQNYYVNISIPSSRRLKHNLGFYLSENRKDVSVKSVLSSIWHVGNRSLLSASFALYQGNFNEENKLWSWTYRGYGFLDDQNVDYRFSGQIKKSLTFTGDVGWKMKMYRQFSLETSLFFRIFRNNSLENQSVTYNAYNYFPNNSVIIDFNQNGKTGGVKFSLNNDINGIVVQQIEYRYQTQFAGDLLFRNVWKSIPQNTARYSMWYRPVKNFTINGILKYLSESHWFEYRGIDSQNATNQSATVNSAVFLDISFLKWFWKRKIWANVIFKNVFNTNHFYHPAGAGVNLRWHVQVGLHLD